jgi:hypothetical protein
MVGIAPAWECEPLSRGSRDRRFASAAGAIACATLLPFLAAGPIHSAEPTGEAGGPDQLWAQLASPDAAVAYRAVCALADRPAEAVALLKSRLRPAAAPDAGRLARLIADLDGPDFDTRERATRELQRLGEQAEPALRRARAAGPGDESRRRIDQILAGRGAITDPELLRAIRGVEVLERIGTPEARHLLKALAEGAPEARLTREARASLERLARRPVPPP